MRLLSTPFKASLTALSVACLLSACGGSDSGSFGFNDSQADTRNTTSGRVIDGYVSGATVCFDANANAICNLNEIQTLSALDGSYTLPMSGDGKVLATGGTNTDTMSPNELILFAPNALAANSSNTRQITPLTTLASIGDSPQDAVALASFVKQGFALATSFDLFRDDPIAGANSNSATADERLAALNVHRAGVQVANTVLTSMALDNDKSAAGQAKKFNTILALITAQMSASQPTNLADESQVRNVLVAGSDVMPSAAQITRLANSNRAVQMSASTSAIGMEQNSYLTALATNPNPMDPSNPGDGDNGGGTTPPDNGDMGGFDPADFLSPTVLCNIPVLGEILVEQVLATLFGPLPLPVPGFDDLACPEAGAGGFEFPSIPGLGLPGMGDAGGDSLLPSFPGLPAGDGGALLSVLTDPLSSGLCLVPVLGTELINALSMIPSNPLLAFVPCPEADGGFEFPGFG